MRIGRPMRWKWAWGVGLGVLAAGCRVAGPAVTATPPIIADCFWSTEVLAWVDTNANGVRDEGEPPLEGVPVNFSLTFYSGTTTDAQGVAHLSGMHPGPCDPELANSVIALAPEGYAVTTDLIVPYAEETERYEFGFRLGE